MEQEQKDTYTKEEYERLLVDRRLEQRSKEESEISLLDEIYNWQEENNFYCWNATAIKSALKVSVTSYSIPFITFIKETKNSAGEKQSVEVSTLVGTIGHSYGYSIFVVDQEDLLIRIEKEVSVNRYN